MLKTLTQLFKNTFSSPQVWHKSEPLKEGMFSAWVIFYCGVCTQETYLPYVEYLENIGFVFYDVNDGKVRYENPKKIADYQIQIMYWSPHRKLPEDAYFRAQELGGGDLKVDKPENTPRPHPRMKNTHANKRTRE